MNKYKGNKTQQGQMEETLFLWFLNARTQNLIASDDILATGGAPWSPKDFQTITISFSTSSTVKQQVLVLRL